MNRKSLESRFWPKVKKSTGCWAWLAAKHVQGYGLIGYGVASMHIKAHRASWIIHFGPIPTGKCVLHKCDNPECTNPEHLFLGTQVENIRDMIQKGRLVTPKGQNQGSAKLTDPQVLCIRARAEEQAALLADEYGVDKTTIWRILSRKSWKHLASNQGVAS